MKRIRTQRPRARRERPGREALPPDPRDPDIVRAKALARAWQSPSAGSGPCCHGSALLSGHIKDYPSGFRVLTGVLLDSVPVRPPLGIP